MTDDAIRQYGNQSPRMANCQDPVCKGRGVVTATVYSDFYQREMQQSVPCKCRLADMAENWLLPLLRLVDRQWAHDHRPKIAPKLLEKWRPEKNLIVECRERAGWLWAIEALKAHLKRAGWQQMLPFLVTSGQEFDDLNWGKPTPLDDVNWRSMRLVIVSVGNMGKGAFAQYFASRLQMLVTLGVPVWMLYHHWLPPQVVEENYCWSPALDAVTDGWTRIKLPAPFAREDSLGAPKRRAVEGPAGPDKNVDVSALFSAGNGG